MDSTLEETLSAVDSQLAAALRLAKSALQELKKVEKVLQLGQMRELGKGLIEARNATHRLADAAAAVDSSWRFDAEQYLEGGGYLRELLHEAERAGLKLFERNGSIYCSPMLLKLAPKDLAVMIDRKPERRLRPRELVKILAARQRKPQRSNEQRFLDAIFEAYSHLSPRFLRDWTPDKPGRGPVVLLLGIYDLLTLLPGSMRDYPKEEFARDVHLLDRKPELRTKDGHSFALIAATGTKNPSQCLTLIDQLNNQKIYAEIRFDKE